jgi:hypothetical protein
MLVEIDRVVIHLVRSRRCARNQPARFHGN